MSRAPCESQPEATLLCTQRKATSRVVGQPKNRAIGLRFCYCNATQAQGSDYQLTKHQGILPTTHWSVVLAASSGDTPQCAAALEQLCRTYWYPLYVYVRRRGYGAEDARDLTQEFFARMLAQHWVSMADPARGRFRTFVLAALNHFLTNEWRRTQCQKRGGAYQIVSWDAETAEGRYLSEPADSLTPEKIFEHRWAAALLERVLQELREEYVAAGKRDFLEAVKQQLWGERTVPQATLAVRLGMTEGALKVALHRLRRRFRELLRFEVGQTVSSASGIDEELRELMSVLCG